MARATSSSGYDTERCSMNVVPSCVMYLARTSLQRVQGASRNTLLNGFNHTSCNELFYNAYEYVLLYRYILPLIHFTISTMMSAVSMCHMAPVFAFVLTALIAGGSAETLKISKCLK